MKLKEQTRACKICFEEIKTINLHSFLCKNQIFCEKCLEKLKPQFIKFTVDGIKGLAIYNYDESIQTYLYQFKGCYDYELKDFFFYRWGLLLSLKYAGYKIVPVPSYYLENEKREFNHVEEIFKVLKLPMLKVLNKTENIKQSSKKQKERFDVINILNLSNIELIRNQKILLVDDVFTTGSTIKACIKLLRTGKPKKISVLVMSKTIFTEQNMK